VLAKNEAARLPRALAAVVSVARLYVVDAESTDATVALARAHGAEVVVRPWEGYVATRRRALREVTTPWTWMLDADEYADAELVAAVAALDPADTAHDAYAVVRDTMLAGRVVRACGWSGERLVRIVRTERATLVARPAAGGTADLHEHWVVPGAVGTLPGRLVHESYPTYASYFAKFARFTSIEAAGAPRSLARLLRAALAAPIRFARGLLGHGALLDGPRSWFVAYWSALYPIVVAWKALRGA
jgi:glycosyltransferase involved in cell wall biosynthesis